MTPVMSRFAVLLTTTGLLGLSLFLGAQPAAAACHVAAFEPDAYTVGEAAGSVTVTIVLVGGQPSCSGAVRYETVAGSASAPGDFTAKDGVLCFVTNDDREESVQIPVTNDGEAEGVESFTVRLEDAQDPACVPDGISGTDTATITITDDDQAAPAPPLAASVATPAPQTSTPTAQTPAETAAASPTALAVEDTTEGSSGRGAVVGLAVAAVLVAGTGGLLAWRRIGSRAP